MNTYVTSSKYVRLRRQWLYWHENTSLMTVIYSFMSTMARLKQSDKNNGHLCISFFKKIGSY
jgi:hypothetical protein